MQKEEMTLKEAAYVESLICPYETYAMRTYHGLAKSNKTVEEFYRCPILCIEYYQRRGWRHGWMLKDMDFLIGFVENDLIEIETKLTGVSSVSFDREPSGKSVHYADEQWKLGLLERKDTLTFWLNVLQNAKKIIENCPKNGQIESEKGKSDEIS